MYLLLEKTKFCPSGMKKNATVTAITTSHLIHQNLEAGRVERRRGREKEKGETIQSRAYTNCSIQGSQLPNTQSLSSSINLGYAALSN